MEPDNQLGTVANRRWQLRWGHILLALFFIILATIAYIVIHQIRTADNATQNALNSDKQTHQKKTTNNTGPNKTPVATAPKSSSPAPTPSTYKSQSTPSPSPSSKNSNSANNSSTQSNGSSTLVNTGPGDTVALFIGTVLIGSLAHHLYTRRRLTLAK